VVVVSAEGKLTAIPMSAVTNNLLGPTEVDRVAVPGKPTTEVVQEAMGCLTARFCAGIVTDGLSERPIANRRPAIKSNFFFCMLATMNGLANISGNRYPEASYNSSPEANGKSSVDQCK